MWLLVKMRDWFYMKEYMYIHKTIQETQWVTVYVAIFSWWWFFFSPYSYRISFVSDMLFWKLFDRKIIIWQEKCKLIWFSFVSCFMYVYYLEGGILFEHQKIYDQIHFILLEHFTCIHVMQFDHIKWNISEVHSL